MSLFDKVFNTLVVEKNERTAAQMASFYNSTPASIKARISEIRLNSGVAVYANKKTDSQGRTKTFYRAGTPTRAVVAAGYRALASGVAA
jgi:predicted ArsR family transcriptional regulator|tara:strand:- start:710 stop:976 length:267 start_codon:yes stop_codon:yes gene_type:complete